MIKGSLNKFKYTSPDGLGYWFDGRIVEHSGIGMEPLKFIEDFGPQQDGSTVRDWRINPRVIQLEIFLEGDSCCETRGEQLAEIINVVRPNRGSNRSRNGWLSFLNDSQILVEIPVFYMQGLTGDYRYNGDIGRWQVSDAVQFYCPDPIWRESHKVVDLVTFEEGSCLGDCLGSSQIVGATDEFCIQSGVFTFFTINYEGTWDGDQIDIALAGRMAEPTIVNTTTGKTIQLDYIISEGQTVLIRIRPEFVTVSDEDGTNLIGSITSLSDLVDFVIESEGEITPTGLNNIIVYFLGGGATTYIELGYWTRHISAYGKPQCV